MAVIRHLRLVDGPIMPRGNIVPSCQVANEACLRWKEQHVRRMADVLVDEDAFADRDDAIRVLRAAGYAAFDIHAMLDEVIMVAQLVRVAKEMSEP